MKTYLPVVIAFLSGFIMIVGFFFTGEVIEGLWLGAVHWATIIGGFSLGLGVVSITRVSWQKIKTQPQERPYAIVLLLCLATMAGFGVFQGIDSGVFAWLFDNIQAPMMATMFSMLAFFLGSAAYRAFRARTVTSAILLVTAVIVMLGRIPMGQLITDGLPTWTNWIMAVPNIAVQRGILIGAGLGAAAMSLRLVLGLERTYMGRG